MTLYCPACGESFIVHCMGPDGLLLSGGINSNLTREEGTGPDVPSGRDRLTVMVDCWPILVECAGKMSSLRH